MKLRVSYAALTVCLFLALATCFERRAYAYVDPGSGILACQAMSAFVAGAVFYLRERVKRLFGSGRR
jgi:hypothetical protein